MYNPLICTDLQQASNNILYTYLNNRVSILISGSSHFYSESRFTDVEQITFHGAQIKHFTWTGKTNHGSRKYPLPPSSPAMVVADVGDMKTWLAMLYHTIIDVDYDIVLNEFPNFNRLYFDVNFTTTIAHNLLPRLRNGRQRTPIITFVYLPKLSICAKPNKLLCRPIQKSWLPVPSPFSLKSLISPQGQGHHNSVRQLLRFRVLPNPHSHFSLWELRNRSTRRKPTTFGRWLTYTLFTWGLGPSQLEKLNLRIKSRTACVKGQVVVQNNGNHF